MYTSILYDVKIKIKLIKYEIVYLLIEVLSKLLTNKCSRTILLMPMMSLHPELPWFLSSMLHLFLILITHVAGKSR